MAFYPGPVDMFPFTFEVPGAYYHSNTFNEDGDFSSRKRLFDSVSRDDSNFNSHFTIAPALLSSNDVSGFASSEPFTKRRRVEELNLPHPYASQSQTWKDVVLLPSPLTSPAESNNSTSAAQDAFPSNIQYPFYPPITIKVESVVEDLHSGSIQPVDVSVEYPVLALQYPDVELEYPEVKLESPEISLGDDQAKVAELEVRLSDLELIERFDRLVYPPESYDEEGLPIIQNHPPTPYANEIDVEMEDAVLEAYNAEVAIEEARWHAKMAYIHAWSVSTSLEADAPEEWVDTGLYVEDYDIMGSSLPVDERPVEPGCCVVEDGDNEYLIGYPLEGDEEGEDDVMAVEENEDDMLAESPSATEFDLIVEDGYVHVRGQYKFVDAKQGWRFVFASDFDFSCEGVPDMSGPGYFEFDEEKTGWQFIPGAGGSAHYGPAPRIGLCIECGANGFCDC